MGSFFFLKKKVKMTCKATAISLLFVNIPKYISCTNRKSLIIVIRNSEKMGMICRWKK